MRITQAHVSKGVRFFEQSFRGKYSLGPITNSREPAVFYGLYDSKDRDIFLNHKGLAIALFAGSDAINPVIFHDALRRENVRIISNSSFIDEDMKGFGLDYISFPVTPSKFTPNPVKRGPCVYAYLPEGKEGFYGVRHMEQAFQMNKNSILFYHDSVKYEFPLIIGHVGKYPKEMMPHIYASCFIGLRLTTHDGLATTVVEMAMMGIPCIYNGKVPGAIPWQKNDPQGLQMAILSASEGIGKVELGLASMMHGFLRNNNPCAWLETDFYIKAKEGVL